MSRATAIFAYSIGRKLTMALTGLFLISFLLVHMSGNMQLFWGSAADFNHYTEFMTTNPFIKASEKMLVLGFVLHIFFAWKLTRMNSDARPQQYAMKKDGETSNWFSRNMGFTGSIILIFLLIHLAMFWGTFHYGKGEMVNTQTAFEQHWKLIDGANVPTVEGSTLPFTIKHEGYIESVEQFDILTKAGIKEVKGLSMYKVTSEAFRQWWIVLLYVAAMILLAFHLKHGFQSAFRTLGLVHKKYSPLIEMLGLAFCIIVPTLFALMPIYHFAKSMMG